MWRESVKCLVNFVLRSNMSFESSYESLVNLTVKLMRENK